MEFSHTYIGNSPLDEHEEETFQFTLTSKEYDMKPANGYIDYVSFDKTHTWRVHMEKNQFGRYMVEIRHHPEQIFETGFRVL